MKKIQATLFLLLTLALSTWCWAETTKYTALSAVTTGTSPVYSLQNVDRVGLQVAWASGVTAGQIVFETAPTVDYSGTWTTAITLDAASSPPSTNADAVEIAAAFGRVRVTTTVSGGGSPSATAYLLLQKNYR